MSALQVYLCGQAHNFDTSNGNIFADQWSEKWNSIPPRPAFISITQACEWIAAMYEGPNPCQTR